MKLFVKCKVCKDTLPCDARKADYSQSKLSEHNINLPLNVIAEINSFLAHAGWYMESKKINELFFDGFCPNHDSII